MTQRDSRGPLDLSGLSQLQIVSKLAWAAMAYTAWAKTVSRAHARWHRWHRWPVVEWWLRLSYSESIEAMCEAWDDYRELLVTCLNDDDLTPHTLHLVNETLLGVTTDLATISRPPGIRFPSDRLNGGVVRIGVAGWDGA